MVERLFLDRIDTEAARSTVTNQPDFVVKALPDIAKTALTFAKSALPRAKIALQATIGQLMPVFCCHDTVFHHLLNWPETPDIKTVN